MLGGQSGDVSCNSYQLWDRDLEGIKQLGLTHYRLSLSWPRLLPDGTTARVNPKGASRTPLWATSAPGPFPTAAPLFQVCGTTTG